MDPLQNWIITLVHLGMTHFSHWELFSGKGWIGNTEDFTFRIMSFPQVLFCKVYLKISREFLQCFRKIGAYICLQRSMWLQRIILAPSSTFGRQTSAFSGVFFSAAQAFVFGKRIAFSVEFLLCKDKIWTLCSLC